MKKTVLATVIPALFIATSVSATELYSDEVNTFSVGGHLSGGLIGSDEGDTKVNSVSPRINFGVTRDLGNGFAANALLEWGINTSGGEQALSTRLAYIGLAHEAYGSAAIGTQWAPTYDVTGYADKPIAFANNFLYPNDMSAMGTGRADDMISYRNGIEFGSNMALNLGLGWQGANVDETTKYDARYQAALSFAIAQFSIGAAYNAGDIDFSGQTKESTATNVSAKYGSYGKGLYVAAVYGDNENVFRGDFNYAEAQDMEAIVAYAFENSINVSLNYEAVDAKRFDNSSSKTLYSQSAVQVEYNFSSNVVGYVGYQVDLGNDINVPEDNVWMIGGRIYL
jgi:predicted porin